MNKTYTERYLLQGLTNKQFKSKYGTMVKSKKTKKKRKLCGSKKDVVYNSGSRIQPKKQRQKWWKSLTPEQQEAYVQKKVSDKAIIRRERSIEIMKHLKPKDCKKCIHGVTQSCTDNLERGCEYYFKVA